MKAVGESVEVTGEPAGLSVGIDKTPLYCDICGKNMRDPETGISLMGVEAGLTISIPFNMEFIAQQLGPYYQEPKTRYQICYECWLRSLGIPEPIAR